MGALNIPNKLEDNPLPGLSELGAINAELSEKLVIHTRNRQHIFHYLTNDDNKVNISVEMPPIDHGEAVKSTILMHADEPLDREIMALALENEELTVFDTWTRILKNAETADRVISEIRKKQNAAVVASLDAGQTDKHYEADEE